MPDDWPRMKYSGAFFCPPISESLRQTIHPIITISSKHSIRSEHRISICKSFCRSIANPLPILSICKSGQAKRRGDCPLPLALQRLTHGAWRCASGEFRPAFACASGAGGPGAGAGGGACGRGAIPSLLRACLGMAGAFGLAMDCLCSLCRIEMDSSA